MLQHRGTSRAGVLTGLLCALLTVGCATTGLQKGQTLVERGRYTEALEVYRQELERRPNNQELKVALNAAKKLEAERLCGMADGRLKADDPQRAFELFANATRYDPSSERAKAGLEASRDLWIKHGERQEQAGRPTEARAIYGASYVSSEDMHLVRRLSSASSLRGPPNIERRRPPIFRPTSPAMR